MPAYSAGGSPTSIAQGDVVTVWNAETPTAGAGGASASQQVAMVFRTGRPNTPAAIDAKFSGAPGAFEVDVQAAAIDADTNYQTVANGNITAVDSTNNTFHFDYNGTAKFLRLLMRSRTNAVSMTATITGG